MQAHPTGRLKDETHLARERSRVDELRSGYAIRGKPDFIALRRPSQTLQIFPASGKGGLMTAEIHDGNGTAVLAERWMI